MNPADAQPVAATPTFDRARFTARLRTRQLGHALVVRARADSTNDDAWDAFAQGAPDGTVVVADEQVRGRGRAGRAWHTAPGHGLAMSVLLHLGCTPETVATLPLLAGIALAAALERLGAQVAVKWPNDVLVGGRKIAGILCETRRGMGTLDAAVIGVGVNVTHAASDFPPELDGLATSLAIEGVRATREDVAAEFLDALEPRWVVHEEGDSHVAIDEWRSRARFFGERIAVLTPAGRLEGVARRLDDDGALVIETERGLERVIAGDVVDGV